jgi:hypothetical protein
MAAGLPRRPAPSAPLFPMTFGLPELPEAD